MTIIFIKLKIIKNNKNYILFLNTFNFLNKEKQEI
jgi:hypothetical protein